MPGRLLRVAREMAWQFWPALAKGDRLLVPSGPPPEYLEYLTGLGLELPEFGVEPDWTRLFTPFGWNREAADLNLRYRNPASHPDPVVVARVNSREFGLRLERELFPENFSGAAAFCRDADELEKWLREAVAGRWVAKGNHGHAGIGQLRFGAPEVSGPAAAGLKRILETQGGLLLEPEQDIAAEFGCLFHLGRDGSSQGPRCHRLLSYSGGGFAGALCLPQDPEFTPWRAEMGKAVAGISGRLRAEGYFGPVGVDAYAWKARGGLRFRPLVDLNARGSMAYSAHGLWRRFPECAVMTAQVPATISFPGHPGELKRLLGEARFNPETGRGAILITPLMPGPRRHAWAFVASGEAEVLALRDRVLRLFR